MPWMDILASGVPCWCRVELEFANFHILWGILENMQTVVYDNTCLWCWIWLASSRSVTEKLHLNHYKIEERREKRRYQKNNVLTFFNVFQLFQFFQLRLISENPERIVPGLKLCHHLLRYNFFIIWFDSLVPVALRTSLMQQTSRNTQTGSGVLRKTKLDIRFFLNAKQEF